MTNWWIKEYKKYHAEHSDYGTGGAVKFHWLHIDDLIKDTKTETLLDYGCGKAEVYEVNDWGWPKPTLYDPAIPEYEKLPDGPFDGIISTDVMEHIPKEQLPEVFDQIFSRATRFVYLGISTLPSKTILSNGENAHCTIEDVGFWIKMIEKYAPKKVYTHIKTYGNCNSYEILNEDLYLEWYLEQLD